MCTITALSKAWLRRLGSMTLLTTTSVLVMGSVLVMAGAAVPQALSQQARELRETTVGMETSWEMLVLPGPELEAIPVTDRRIPLIVRIAEAIPHGNGFRYHLTFYGLEPGDYDLRSALRRKDGSPTTDLPEIPVRVKSLLPPGHVLPNDLAAKPLPYFGGYRWLLVAAGLLWMIGLLALIFVRRRPQTVAAVTLQPMTMADLLRPLVERGIAGRLSLEERAELERALLSYWRRRLGLDHVKPIQAFERLREHGDAGPLLRQLERWLHQPGQQEAVDLASLLKPYEQLPAEALTWPPERATA